VGDKLKGPTKDWINTDGESAAAAIASIEDKPEKEPEHETDDKPGKEQFLLTIAEKNIRLYLLPEQDKHKEKVMKEDKPQSTNPYPRIIRLDNESPILRSDIIRTAMYNNALVLIDASGTFNIYPLLQLTEPIYSFKIAEFTSRVNNNLNPINITQGGRFLYMLSKAEVLIGSLLKIDRFTPKFLPQLYKPDIKAPAKPANASFFKTLNSVINLKQTAGMNELMDEYAPITRQDVQKAEASKTPPSETQKVQEVQAQVASSSNNFSELRNKMNERGEKLSRLDEAVISMNQESQNFLDQIREYNKREANKKWYQL